MNRILKSGGTPLFAALVLLFGWGGTAKAQTVQDTVNKVKDIAARGDRAGYVYSPQLLRHWLGASGNQVILPSSAFAGQDFFLKHLALTHRNNFVAYATNYVRQGTLVPGRPRVMTWINSVRGQGDLFYALGDFTVFSQVQVSVTRVNATQYRLDFNAWQSSIMDRYDWDPNKTYVLPPFILTGREMIAVEAAGRAKPFSVGSGLATIAAPSVVGSVVIRP